DLNRNFRNEGIDRSHNPEFTMLEWYEAYTDYNYQMKQVEDLLSHVAKVITGSTVVTYQGKEVNFTTPWKRWTMMDAIKEYGKVDVNGLSDSALLKKLDDVGYEYDPKKKMSRGEMVAGL